MGAAVERLLGRHDAAKRRLEDALEATGAAGPHAARLAGDLAVGAYERGDYPEMSQWATRATQGPDATRVVRAATAALLGLGAVLHQDLDTAAEHVGEALREVDAAGDAELAAGADLLISVPWALLALERLQDGLAVAQRASALAQPSGSGVAAVAIDIAGVLALGLLAGYRRRRAPQTKPSRPPAPPVSTSHCSGRCGCERGYCSSRVASMRRWSR